MLKRLYLKAKHFVLSLGEEVRRERRETLKRIYLKKENNNSFGNDFIHQKMQSMKHSQGKSDFSGSSYNGPGNVDREKINSNMAHRNY
jgi:hypothetical protein